MKHIILVTLLVLAQNSFGKSIDDRIYLENTETANLQSDLAELSVSVSYPMEEMSGVCSLDIVADSYNRHHQIEKLLDRVEILNFFELGNQVSTVISSTVIRVNLRPSYVDGIIVRTKNGSSLKEAIAEALGPDRKVVIMPRSCR